MNCPKCVGTLNEVRYGDAIVVERCDHCAGLFCPAEMLLAIRQEYLVEAVLDIGHPDVGSQLDTVDEVCCPSCQVPMTASYDPEQVHIWYEICPRCAGTWLDAGELTDLKYQTLMDCVRGLLKGRRPEGSARS